MRVEGEVMGDYEDRYGNGRNLTPEQLEHERDPEADAAAAEAAYDAHREAAYTTCPRCHARVVGTIYGLCCDCHRARKDEHPAVARLFRERDERGRGDSTRLDKLCEERGGRGDAA